MEHNGTQLLQKFEKRRTQFWDNDADGKTRNKQ